MTDLSKYSLDELRLLEKRVAEQLKILNEQEKAKAREQILAIAQSVGVPLKELFDERAVMKGQSRGNAAPIRFRNPSNNEQSWSGRGRKPKWVQEWIGLGRPIDELRVC